MSQARDESRELGSKWLWLLSRLILLFPSAGLLAVGLVRGVLAQLFVLLALLVLWLPNYALAYGQADDDSISFCRFFRKHRVSWDHVEKIDWIPSRSSFFITLERPIGGFATARFHSFRMRSRGQGPRPEDEVPEIVLWIAGQIKLHEAFPASK